MRTSRRHALAPLLLLLAVAVAACSRGDGRENADGSATTAVETTDVPTTAEPEPPRPAWAPGPTEPAVEVKLAATRAVEAVGNYDDGGGTVASARRRLEAEGLEPGFADSADVLLGKGAATVDVVYPQLSGLARTEAGVMVIVDLRRDGARKERRVIDVRVAGGAGAWRATAIASDPAASSGPTPGAATEELLESPGIDLPSTAVDDLRRGAVDGRLVALLARWVADGRRVAVTVFSTGHPRNVFDTDRPSNHTAGRAVDIWAVDGTPVAADQQSPLLRALVDDAVAAGATEVGAPFDSDGVGGNVFTNTVHQDHLHVAFDG